MFARVRFQCGGIEGGRCAICAYRAWSATGTASTYYYGDTGTARCREIVDPAIFATASGACKRSTELVPVV